MVAHARDVRRMASQVAQARPEVAKLPPVPPDAFDPERYDPMATTLLISGLPSRYEMKHAEGVSGRTGACEILSPWLSDEITSTPALSQFLTSSFWQGLPG
jgi:hypothetical protein